MRKEHADTAAASGDSGDINIALVGEMASQTYIGDYSGTPTKTVSPYEGLKEKFGEDNVHFLGHADDDDVLFNIKSINLVLKNGTERTVDLSTATDISGAELSDGALNNVTPTAKATIPSVDFSDVTDVEIEMATGTDSVGGTVYIGYSNDSNIKAEIASQTTASLDDYTVCSGEYTGEDGGYNETADMCITVQANSSFDIEKYKTQLDEADIIIAYAGTMVGGAEEETGLVADGHESNDRTTISLPYRDRHVSEICNYVDESGNYVYADKTAVVMQTVGEIDVTPFEEHCRAILWTSYNGQKQGEALANALSGDVNTSGKLTSTWYAPSDLEIMTCGGVNTTDSEGITWKRNNYNIRQTYDENGNCTWPGRTYMYYNGTPQYPFGYGLSYTKFEYSDLKLSAASIDANGTLSATVNVTNTGTVKGTEIAQIYVHYENGDGISLPLQQLSGFARVEDIEPGETRAVTIDVNIKNLAQYSERLEKYYMPTGNYELWVGANVTDKAVSADFEITGSFASTIKTVSSIPSGITVSDAKYRRLGELSSGEQFDEINGVGGYGDFNDISGVNYTYTYGGTTYTLTGGFQGGKASFKKSNIYFRPFECYQKATVTVFFDSAGEERITEIAQQTDSGEKTILASKGGEGSKKIVSVTAEVTDLTRPVYILPQNKDSIYMIVVDYE